MSEWTDRQYRILSDDRVISKVVGVTYEPGYPQSAFILLKARIGYTFNPQWPDNEEDWKTYWDNDPDGVGEMMRRNFIPPLSPENGPELIAGVLIRDLKNPHDANTIEVHVPLLECRVGFLPTKLAQELAPELDAGEHYVVQTWAVPNLMSPEHPGIRVLLTPAWLDDANRILEALDGV